MPKLSAEALFLMTLVGWLARELYALWKERRREDSGSLKELGAALHKLTLTVHALAVQMEGFQRELGILWKLSRDVDAAHKKLREITGSPRLGEGPRTL